MKKNKTGLYFKGKFMTASYIGAIKELFGLKKIPDGFCIDEDHNACGYSIVDNFGIQHIYELCHAEFYSALMRLA